MIKDYEIGCRKCGKGGNWAIFTDGKKLTRAVCRNCGHEIFFNESFELTTSTDSKAIDLRLLT